MNHTTLTLCMYLLAPPAPSEPPKVDAAHHTSEATAEPGILALLEQANADADEDSLRTIERLTAALEAFAMFEDSYTDDPHALELRTLSQLSLARAQLAAENELAASATIQAAIRDRHGEALPAESFGPTLTRLYLEQRDLLMSAGQATVTLPYATPCEFVINGKPVDKLIIKLPLGTYRVHVRALDGSAESYVRLELGTAGEVVTITPDIKPPAPIDDGDLGDDPTPIPDSQRLPGPAQSTWSPSRELRKARAAETIGGILMGVGGVMMVGGGVAVGASAAAELYAVLGLAGCVGVIGTVNLIVGGAIYGAGVTRENRALAKTRLGSIAPVLVFDRNGGRVGVSMRF